MHSFSFTAKIEGLLRTSTLTTEELSYDRPFKGELHSNNNAESSSPSIQATGLFLAKKISPDSYQFIMLEGTRHTYVSEGFLHIERVGAFNESGKLESYQDDSTPPIPCEFRRYRNGRIQDEKKGYFKDDFMVEGDSTHYIEVDAQQIRIQMNGLFENDIFKAGGTMKTTSTVPGSLVSTSMMRFTRDYQLRSEQMFGEEEVCFVYANDQPTLTQRKTGQFKKNRLIEGELFLQLSDGTGRHRVETGIFDDSEELHNVSMPKKKCFRHVFQHNVLTETLEGIFSAGIPFHCAQNIFNSTPFIESYGKWKVIGSAPNQYNRTALHDPKGVKYRFDQITHTGMWQEGFCDGAAIAPHISFHIKFKNEQLFSVTKEDKEIPCWSMIRQSDGEYHYQSLMATSKKPNKLEKEEAILSATTQFEYIDAWLISKKKVQPFRSTLTFEDLIKKEAEEKKAHLVKKQAQKKKDDEERIKKEADNSRKKREMQERKQHQNDEIIKQKKQRSSAQQAYLASVHESVEPQVRMPLLATPRELQLHQETESHQSRHQLTFFETGAPVLTQEKQKRILTEVDERSTRQDLFFFDERVQREILSRGHAIIKLAPSLPLAHCLPGLIVEEDDDADLRLLVLALYRMRLMSFLIKEGLCFNLTSMRIFSRKEVVERTLLRYGINLIELENRILIPAVRMASSAWLFHLTGGVLSLESIQAEMQDCFDPSQWCKKTKKWDKALVKEAWIHEVYAMYRTLGLPVVDTVLVPLSRAVPAELNDFLREGAAVYIQTLPQLEVSLRCDIGVSGTPC